MYKNDLNTNSGMWAVWDYEAYKDVDAYDQWEPLFCEDADIERQIKNRTFIPINISEDGCCSFTVKVDEELNDREQKYVCVQSEPYLLRTSGKVIVSGIDYINQNMYAKNSIVLDLPAGHYTVKIYLIGWDEEPGAYLDNGEVSPNALSDFVIVLRSNANPDDIYRERINTFSEDDDR